MLHLWGKAETDKNEQFPEKKVEEVHIFLEIVVLRTTHIFLIIDIKVSYICNLLIETCEKSVNRNMNN